MNPIPETENSLLLRTDFNDDSAWNRVRAMIEEPVGDFQAYVSCVNDRSYEGATVDDVVRVTREAHGVVLVVDRLTIEHPEHPVLVVDLLDEPGRTFRVVPSEAWSVENNLSIANMSFEEFADSVGEDGIFRGFSDA